jgi:diguanylate cyclase (GGDEF)-like protein
MLGLIPANDPYQALRLRRFLTAAAVYGALIALTGAYVVVGLMGLDDWLRATGAIVAINGVMFALLRSGRNEQLSDPSLTLIQVITACFVTAFVAFQVDGARGALLLILMALLMFGAFRLRIVAFLVVGLFAVASYAAVIMALRQFRPEALELRIALLQLVALTTAVACGALFVGYVGGLRRQLRSQQLELQRANEAVHELSIQDGLTGVQNRGEIVRLLSEECERARRLEMSLTVAMLDLDRFKAINREHNHTTGDIILRRVAATLEDGVRAVDTVGRYGGEEFLLVLPDTTLESGCETAEGLRRLCSRVSLGDLADELALSVSIGVATYRQGESAEALIERARECADHALDAGGNSIVTEAALYSESPGSGVRS